MWWYLALLRISRRRRLSLAGGILRMACSWLPRPLKFPLDVISQEENLCVPVRELGCFRTQFEPDSLKKVLDVFLDACGFFSRAVDQY